MESAADLPVRLLVTVVALGAVLLLAWAILRFVGRFALRRGAGGRLKLIETLTVGSRERLLLVSVDSREFLVGVTPTHVDLLRTWTRDPPVEPKTDNPETT